MRLKLLYEDRFEVVATMEGDDCETDDFLNRGQDYLSSRQGLQLMLAHVAKHGLSEIPAAWFHEANKNEKIYEFIKGDLRLFFFKGDGRRIAVCTTGVLKKGRKADKSAVAKAIKLRAIYIAAVTAKTIEVMTDENE